MKYFNSITFYVAYGTHPPQKEIAATQDIDAFAIKSFSSIQTELGLGIPLGESLNKIKLLSHQNLIFMVRLVPCY